MSRARDNADLGDSYGVLGAGVTGGSGLTALGTVTEGTLGSGVTFPAGMMRFIVNNEPTVGTTHYSNGNKITQQVTITSGSKVLIHVGYNYEDSDPDTDTTSATDTWLAGDGTSGLGTTTSGFRIHSATEKRMVSGARGGVHGTYLATPTGTTPTYYLYLQISGSPLIKWWHAYMTFYEIYQ